MRVLDPQPEAGELPARFPSPFARAPHPLARRAADELIAELRGGRGELHAALEAPGGGKMFGVLVCARADGVIGVVRAFSGMLGGRWHVDGFAPPVFDLAARDAWWRPCEAELGELAARHAALAASDDTRAARATLGELEARVARDVAALHRPHDREERRAHHAERRALRDDPVIAHARAVVAAIDAELADLAEQRAARSRDFLVRIHAGYTLTSVRGESRTLRELFAPSAPPGGAGDCAAPKLLVHAQRLGLRPLALAEVWWGAPPHAGGRHAGAFYPACRGKCGAIVPFLLDGLPVDDAPVFGGGPIAAAEPRVLYEDAQLVIVGKPCGLLSVPGRGGALRDSVQTRLAARVVHRLDLDASGVLVVARDAATYKALQAQFARREIRKRYIAWLAGDVAGEAGEIALPLRVDVDDRPRQIVDDVHGKPAHTTWRVLAREGGRTRVALEPTTGRTHQLRVHCAHARGLGAPICGDRLYGGDADADRLELHAEWIQLVHPVTGQRLEVSWPAPF